MADDQRLHDLMVDYQSGRVEETLLQIHRARHTFNPGAVESERARGWRLFCHFSEPAHVRSAHVGAVLVAMLVGSVLASAICLAQRRS